MNKITDIFNFLSVEKLLTTSGQPTEAQLSVLANQGYEVVINLSLHNDPRYSLPDETGLVKSLGMIYVHIPVPFDAPSESDLDSFFHAMETNINKKVHVHCAANMRVTAFLGLYFMIRQVKSKEEAFATMKSIWEPDDVWSSFITSMLTKRQLTCG
jgi:protein tyrosine phosphatase (PTP) superfamily phosphohydrolase (DUF442 family)